MKTQSKVLVALATSTLLSALGLAFAKPSEAAPRTFSCEYVSGVWTTLVSESGQPQKQMIRWTTDFGASVGYTPERRCKEVTNRMNLYLSKGGKYITYGIMNDQNVICTTNTLGQDCLNLLYTLNPDKDPKLTLEDLFAVSNSRVQKPPLRECTTIYTYISVDALVAGKTRFAEEACSPR